MTNQYKNSNLNAARNLKYDEFFTKLSDIAAELPRYAKFFKGKTLYCNCDDPNVSQFTAYLQEKRGKWGIREVISTAYVPNGNGICGRNGTIRELEGDGDFRSPECVEILKQTDIVVTNPPFSLIREYIAQLEKYHKEFIIVAPLNVLTYNSVFPLFKDGKIRLGGKFQSGIFDKLDGGQAKFGNIIWLTSLPVDGMTPPIPLTETYTPERYPQYDNYYAINVDRVKDIPKDYFGPMGVPASFLQKWCPSQFEILNANDYSKEWMPRKKTYLIKDHYDGNVNGVPRYVRIIIKRK